MKKIFFSLTISIFVISFGMSQELPSYVPMNGLVAYYPFNGNANDASGNGHDGTVYLEPQLSEGYSGTAYDFEWDEVNGYGSPWQRIELPYIDSFHNTDFVFSAWIKPESFYWPNNNIQNAMIIGSSNACGNFLEPSDLRFVLHNGDGSITFLVGPDILVDSGPGAINLNSWQHVLARVSSDKIDLFVNNVLVNSESHSQVPNFAGCMVIGEHHQSNGHWYYFDGLIDEVGIWNRALSDKEIENLYKSSSGDILLNGIVSVESNQIKNVADPTDNQDATTKNYVDIKTSEILISQDFSNNSQIGLTGVVYDFEGNRYETIVMCDGKQWTTQYLNASFFANGEQIPEVTGNEEWRDLTTPAWCYSYNQDNSRGKIYNGFALKDERGLAPVGWHIATEEEWNDLIDCLGGTEVAGGKLKISGTQYWTSPNVGSGVTGIASNSSGMSLLPDGFREGANGNFYSENEFISIWNYSETPDLRPYVQLHNDKAEILKGLTDPYDGAHILLVKD